MAAPGPGSRKRPAEGLAELEPRTYTCQRILGKGSFGLVYQAEVQETGEVVAVKSTRMKKAGGEAWMQLNGESEREVQVLLELNGHPNVVNLRGAFLSAPADGKDEQEYTLNLVLEYMSDTLHRVLKHYMNVRRKNMDQYYVQLYQYQLLRAVGFIHGLGIMHCDIKPQNLLLDGRTHTLKMADFGTAKRLHVGRTLASYVCSRYYRAPELILGSTTYGTSVDLWSAGCVLGEMILGQPLFTGGDGIDQLVQIIKVIGTPTPEDLKAMNSCYPRYAFTPSVPPLAWDKVFKHTASKDACELAGHLLKFDPASRLPPLYCLMHRFFNALRSEEKLEHRPLFEFLPEELLWCSAAEKERLVPKWMEAPAS
ncbi:unnamed protein product [Prorocentrum cordatum]|uniref:Protein kinase domain-containing protein n=1 Tax=Prorocentrum cordatum TaxID=2364126 RepID=A0ABN9STG5_9DINO|nr:unnamed protein product [Polarella glacialis]